MNPQDQGASQVPAPTPAPVPILTSSPIPAPIFPVSSQKIPGPFELFQSGWKLFINHWKVLVPIVILPSVIMYVGTLLNFTHQVAFSILGVLFSIVGVIISVAMVPAIVDAVNRFSTESSVTISLKDQYRRGFTYFWSVIFIAIIYSLIGLGSFFLFIIPGIIVALYVSLYSYTLIIDGKRGFSALIESYSLVYGRWWSVLGRMVFLVISMLIMWLVLLGAGFLFGLTFGIPVWEATQSVGKMAAEPFGTSLISFIFNMIGNAVLVPITIGYTYKMYTSLKAIRNTTISTNIFKRWLIAFLCIGTVTIIVGIILIPTLII